MKRRAKGSSGDRPHLWWRFLLLIGLFPWAAQAADRLTQAWLDAAQLFGRDANEAFAQVAKAGPPDRRREAALGEAMTLMEVPPRTDGRVEQSAAALRRLCEENADDATGLAACYLLGRMRQVFGAGGPAEAAPPELLSLAKDHAETVFGQLAMLKLTLHQLYLPQPEPAVAARFQAVAGYEAKFTDPGLLREYHLTVANAQIFFQVAEPEALRHLRAALQLGIPNAVMRADVLVQIGELARARGQSQVAMASYRRFLEENVHDERIMMVRDRLAELEAAQARDA